MKKWMPILILVLTWCLLGQSAFAASNADQLKGEPKLMVTAVNLEPEIFEAGSEAILTITIKNTNESRYIKNAIFIFSEANGEIIPVEQGSIFVEKIAKGDEYTWSLKVRAIPTASSGVHTAIIDMAYEDNAHMPHTANSKIYIDLRQPVRLFFEEPKFPPRVTQGNTPSFSIALMNLGKSKVSNALLSFKTDGLANVGSILVGSIDPGESKTGSTNFRIDTAITGLAEGVVTLTYEDDFGEMHEARILLKTTIEQRIVQAPLFQKEETSSSIAQKNWFLPVSGIAILLLIVAAALGVIHSRQRRKDEAKL